MNNSAGSSSLRRSTGFASAVRGSAASAFVSFLASASYHDGRGAGSVIVPDSSSVWKLLSVFVGGRG